MPLGAARIIQTFCLPVSLITVIRMHKGQTQIAAVECLSRFDWDGACRSCCRETIS